MMKLNERQRRQLKKVERLAIAANSRVQLGEREIQLLETIFTLFDTQFPDLEPPTPDQVQAEIDTWNRVGGGNLAALSPEAVDLLKQRGSTSASNPADLVATEHPLPNDFADDEGCRIIDPAHHLPLSGVEGMTFAEIGASLRKANSSLAGVLEGLEFPPKLSLSSIPISEIHNGAIEKPPKSLSKKILDFAKKRIRKPFSD